MNYLATSPASAETPTDIRDTRLPKRWLPVARGVWLGLALLTLALFLASLPAFWAFLLQQPCRSAAACNLFGALSPAQTRALQAVGFSIKDIAIYFLSLNLASALIWSAVGILIFWRRSDDWLALLVALALILFPTAQQGAPPSALALLSPAWSMPITALSFLGQASFAVFLYLFPNGRFAPRWTRWFALLYLAQTVLSLVPPSLLPFSATLAPIISGGAFASAAVVGLYSNVYRYRRISSPVQRQQIKWAVLGIASAITLVVALNLSNAIPGLGTSSAAYLIIENLFPFALLPIPLSIGLAILRYRLWDVDAIINKALVYGVLTAVLGALYAGLILCLESLAQRVAPHRISNQFVLVVSTLAIAALFQPARRRIQSMIDRRFYRRNYDAAKTLAAFSAILKSEVDLEQLRAHLLAATEETMQPAHFSLWVRPPEEHDAVIALHASKHEIENGGRRFPG